MANGSNSVAFIVYKFHLISFSLFTQLALPPLVAKQGIEPQPNIIYRCYQTNAKIKQE